jgi:hypothetical protein
LIIIISSFIGKELGEEWRSMIKRSEKCLFPSPQEFLDEIPTSDSE